MNLAKALKVKNQLAGEVTELKERLTKQNVRPASQPFDYNAADVLAGLREKIDHLIVVKSAIAAANVHQYPKIFRLAELKGLIVLLKALDTRHGIFKEGGSYAEPASDVEYVAQIRKSVIDELVAAIESEIVSLQDDLDDFNATHPVSIES